MPFTGNEDQDISLNDAATLTERYRQAGGAAAVLAGYFGKSAILKILNQTNCVGIRAYYGTTTDDKPKLVLVGVTSNENDMYNGILIDHSYDCPPYCSQSNPLNS